LFSLGGLNDQLRGGGIVHSLLLDVDVVVRAAFVHDLNMRMLVLHNFILDGAVVAVFGIVFDLSVNLRVFREDLS
jgi:hypothetical protein